MQGVGYADVLLYLKCLADAVPCERLPRGKPAEAKQAVAARGYLFFWLKGMHILPGQACPVKRAACFSGVAQVKRVCLRYVSVCLRIEPIPFLSGKSISASAI
jgi:hypothetical protein